jgi:hypothetical protein
MTTIEINENDRGIIQICLEIGRARFEEHTRTLANSRAIDQFARQAQDAERLHSLLSAADRVVVETEADAA